MRAHETLDPTSTGSARRDLAAALARGRGDRGSRLDAAARSLEARAMRTMSGRRPPRRPTIDHRHPTPRPRLRPPGRRPRAPRAPRARPSPPPPLLRADRSPAPRRRPAAAPLLGLTRRVVLSRRTPTTTSSSPGARRIIIIIVPSVVAGSASAPSSSPPRLDAAASTARDAMIAAREAETLRRLADLEASGANLAVPRAEPSATPVEFRTPRGRVPSARGARTSIGTSSAYTTSARSHHPSGNHSEEASGSFGKRFDRSFGGDLRECLGASGDLREGLGAGRRSDPGASGGAARRDAGDGMRKFLAKYGLERYAAFRPPRGHRS